MPTVSKFNHVKAAMAAVLSLDGKSLDDLERDLSKLAADSDKKDKKEKKDRSTVQKIFPMVALPFTVGNSMVNAGATALRVGGSGLASLDKKMGNDDKDVSAIKARTQVLQSALEELKRKYPHLSS